MTRKFRIAFDVNGTLSHPLVRELFKSIDRERWYVIVWSTLGKGYAKKFCEEHDLIADEFMNKQVEEVDVAVDDIPDSIQAAKLVLGVR